MMTELVDRDVHATDVDVKPGGAVPTFPLPSDAPKIKVLTKEPRGVIVGLARANRRQRQR